VKELLHTSDFDGFPLDLQQAMVADEQRVRAFERALNAAVRPGDTVVDVGSGTGILALLALRAGAARVIAFERSEIVEHARALLRKSYPDANIEFVRLDVEREPLPEIEADVLVCELLGNLGPEERLVPLLARLRDALLKPGGRLIPERLKLCAAPVRSRTVYNELTTWSRPVSGFDLSVFQELAWNRVYHLQGEELELLAEPGAYTDLDLHTALAMPSGGACEFLIHTAGELHGVVAWFEAQLSRDVQLSTAPDAPVTHWGQVFFPTGPVLSVGVGDRLRFELQLASDDFEVEWSWKGELNSAAGEEHAFEYLGRGST